MKVSNVVIFRLLASNFYVLVVLRMLKNKADVANELLSTLSFHLLAMEIKPLSYTLLELVKQYSYRFYSDIKNIYLRIHLTLW